MKVSGRVGGMRTAVGDGMAVSVGTGEVVAVGSIFVDVALGEVVGGTSVGAAHDIRMAASNPRAQRRGAYRLNVWDILVLYQTSPAGNFRQGCFRDGLYLYRFQRTASFGGDFYPFKKEIAYESIRQANTEFLKEQRQDVQYPRACDQCPRGGDPACERQYGRYCLHPTWQDVDIHICP